MNRILLSLILTLAPVSTVRAQMLQAIVGSKAPSAGGNTFTLVQRVMDQGGLSGSAVACPTSTCTVTVASLGAGHLGILMISDANGSGNTVTSITGGGTWVLPASGYFSNSCCADNIGAYTLNTTGGAVLIAVTFAGNPFGQAPVIDFYEFSVSPGPAAFDVGNGIHDTACTVCASPALTITGTSNVNVFLEGGSSSAATSAASPYNTNFRNTGTASAGAFSFASGSYVINSASGAATTFTGASRQTAGLGMSFK